MVTYDANRFNVGLSALAISTYILSSCSRNVDPVSFATYQGVRFLQAQNVLGESSSEIAQWLFKGELLNKRAIGDYLGEG